MSSPFHFLRNGTVNVVHQIPKSFRIAPTLPGKSLDGLHDCFSVPVNIHDDFPFMVGESFQDSVTSIPGVNVPNRSVGILTVVPQDMAYMGRVVTFRHSIHPPRLLHSDLYPVNDLETTQTGQESNTFNESRYTCRLVGRFGGMECGKVVTSGFILIRFRQLLPPLS